MIVIFRLAREKLLGTVALDHPVAMYVVSDTEIEEYRYRIKPGAMQAV